MSYSKEFIAKVKEVLPHDKKIHEMAERGEYFLGRYLDDASDTKMSIDTILLATSLEELQKKARGMKVRLELYTMWNKEVGNLS